MSTKSREPIIKAHGVFIGKGSSLQDRVRALCFQVTAAKTEVEMSALLPLL